MKTVRDQLDISPIRAQELGQETARILIKASYTSLSGKYKSIQEHLSQAITGTITYGPEQPR